MNRKQALKRMKQDKKNKNTFEETNYVNRFVMTLGLVLIVLIGSYLIIGIFVTKTIKFGTEEKKEEKTEVSIDNSTILMGQVFDQKESDYYVLIYNPKDNSSIIKNWKQHYDLKTDGIKMYVVNSNDQLNKKYITKDNSNKNPTGYSDLRVKDPTLIKISNKSVSAYIEGDEQIVEALK